MRKGVENTKYAKKGGGGGEGGMMMNDVTKNTVCTLRREQRSPGTSRDSEDPLQAT